MLEFLDMNDSGTRTRDTVKATPRGKHKVISTSTKDIKTKSSDVTRERRKLRTKCGSAEEKKQQRPEQKEGKHL